MFYVKLYDTRFACHKFSNVLTKMKQFTMQESLAILRYLTLTLTLLALSPDNIVASCGKNSKNIGALRV